MGRVELSGFGKDREGREGWVGKGQRQERERERDRRKVLTGYWRHDYDDLDGK